MALIIRKKFSQSETEAWMRPECRLRGRVRLDQTNRVGDVDGTPVASVIMAVVKDSHVHLKSASDVMRLLDLDSLAIDRVESDVFGGRAVHVVTPDQHASACPHGPYPASAKGLLCTQLRDIPYGTTQLRLICQIRRWRRMERQCSRYSSTELARAVPVGPA